jgi:type III secretion system low calcium response chaperone LcrH/SycD
VATHVVNDSLKEFLQNPREDLRLTEEVVEKFYSFGYAHYESGNWNEASDIFRLLCIRRPLEPRFWFALGATFQEAGNYKEALHSWAMVALLSREDPYPHFHAAECCFSLLLSDEAAKALNEAEARIPQSEDHPLKDKILLLRQQWRL